MNKSYWYCPRCGVLTGNWRKCQRCKEPAIYQNFLLVPVPHPPKKKREIKIFTGEKHELK